MRNANSIVNETMVVAGLRKAGLIATQASLLLGDGGVGGGGRNRRVIINEERVCGVCHKRLGGSVVAAMPDNSVVHYGCLSRAQAQSQTGGAGSGAGSASLGGSSIPKSMLGSWGRIGTATGTAGGDSAVKTQPSSWGRTGGDYLNAQAG